MKTKQAAKASISSSADDEKNEDPKIAPQARAMLQRLDRCENFAKEDLQHLELIKWVVKVIGEQHQNQLDEEKDIARRGEITDLLGLKLRRLGLSQTEDARWFSLKLARYQAIGKVLELLVKYLETLERDGVRAERIDLYRDLPTNDFELLSNGTSISYQNAINDLVAFHFIFSDYHKNSVYTYFRKQNY